MYFTSEGYLRGSDEFGSAAMAKKAFEFKQCRFSAMNVHKYLCCRCDASTMYRGSRELVCGPEALYQR